MKEARIRVLTNEPDYSDYQDPEYDWSSSVYGDVKEIIPMDIAISVGEIMIIIYGRCTRQMVIIYLWMVAAPGGLEHFLPLS
jgi:hypothetical protein